MSVKLTLGGKRVKVVSVEPNVEDEWVHVPDDLNQRPKKKQKVDLVQTKLTPLTGNSPNKTDAAICPCCNNDSLWVPNDADGIDALHSVTCIVNHLVSLEKMKNNPSVLGFDPTISKKITKAKLNDDGTCSWFICPKHGKVVGKPTQPFTPFFPFSCYCGLEILTLQPSSSSSSSNSSTSTPTNPLSNIFKGELSDCHYMMDIDDFVGALITECWTAERKPSFQTIREIVLNFLYSFLDCKTEDALGRTSPFFQLQSILKAIGHNGDQGFKIYKSLIIKANLPLTVTSPSEFWASGDNKNTIVIKNPYWKKEYKNQPIHSIQPPVREPVPGSHGCECLICFDDVSPMVDACRNNQGVDAEKLSKVIWYSLCCNRPFHLPCINGTFQYDSHRTEYSPIIYRHFACPNCRQVYGKSLSPEKTTDSGIVKKTGASIFLDMAYKGTVFHKGVFLQKVGEFQALTEWEKKSSFNPLLSFGVF